jgi:hypothetical protein
MGYEAKMRPVWCALVEVIEEGRQVGTGGHRLPDFEFLVDAFII